jgi:hypothetical protein
VAKRLRKVIQVVELEVDLDIRHSDETNHFASSDDQDDREDVDNLAWEHSDNRKASWVDQERIVDMGRKISKIRKPEEELLNRRKQDRSKDQKQKYMVLA